MIRYTQSQDNKSVLERERVLYLEMLSAVINNPYSFLTQIS